MEGGAHMMRSPKSVSDAWNKIFSAKTFKNVHGRMQFIVVCVVDDKGLNELVEKKRGKMFCYSTLPNI